MSQQTAFTNDTRSRHKQHLSSATNPTNESHDDNPTLKDVESWLAPLAELHNRAKEHGELAARLKEIKEEMATNTRHMDELKKNVVTMFIGVIETLTTTLPKQVKEIMGIEKLLEELSNKKISIETEHKKISESLSLCSRNYKNLVKFVEKAEFLKGRSVPTTDKERKDMLTEEEKKAETVLETEKKKKEEAAADSSDKLDLDALVDMTQDLPGMAMFQHVDKQKLSPTIQQASISPLVTTGGASQFVQLQLQLQQQQLQLQQQQLQQQQQQQQLQLQLQQQHRQSPSSQLASQSTAAAPAAYIIGPSRPCPPFSSSVFDMPMMTMPPSTSQQKFPPAISHPCVTPPQSPQTTATQMRHVGLPPQLQHYIAGQSAIYNAANQALWMQKKAATNTREQSSAAMVGLTHPVIPIPMFTNKQQIFAASRSGTGGYADGMNMSSEELMRAAAMNTEQKKKAPPQPHKKASSKQQQVTRKRGNAEMSNNSDSLTSRPPAKKQKTT